jgi:hypothetical protein
MATTVVLIVAVVLVAAVLYWSGAFGDKRRGSGTSLRRGPHSHTTARGTPKKGYDTRDQAVAQAKSMAKRGEQPMSAYRCDTCSKWHVGH